MFPIEADSREDSCIIAQTPRMKQGADGAGSGLSSQNRRKSQLRRLKNRFLGCFFGFCDPKSRLFDRKSPICFGRFGRISNSHRGLCRWSFDWHSPQLPTENRPSATQNRPSATFSRHLETFSRHLETISRHFETPCKSRLTSHRLRLFDFWVSCGLVPNLNCDARGAARRSRARQNWAEKK